MVSLSSFKNLIIKNDIFILLAITLLLPLRIFAQDKNAPFKRHDIAVGFTTGWANKSQHHDAYISCEHKPSIYVSYAYNVTKWLGVGVTMHVVSEHEELSGHGDNDMRSLLLEIKACEMELQNSRNNSHIESRLQGLKFEYERYFGKYYNEDGSDNFVKNHSLVVIPFVRFNWYRKCRYTNEKKNTVWNFGMYSDIGYGMNGIIEGELCTAYNKKTNWGLMLRPFCIEGGWQHIRLNLELGYPSTVGIKVGL